MPRKKRNPFNKLIANVRQNTLWLIDGGDPDNPKHWRLPTSKNNKERTEVYLGLRKKEDCTGSWLLERPDRIDAWVPRKCFLSAEDLERIWHGQKNVCGWFGVDVDPEEIYTTNSPWAISVDRIDDEGDYDYGNIMVTTRFANLGRCRSTFDQTSEFLARLITKLKKLPDDFKPGYDTTLIDPPPPIKTVF